MKNACFVQQYNLKKRVEKFGEEGRKATMKELDQLHKRNCFTPILVRDMTREEKTKPWRH